LQRAGAAGKATAKAVQRRGLIRAGVVEVDALVIQMDWALPRCLGNNRITLA
jgi:hypothetical protein